ncbi:MAG: glycosyltransferase [Burkholderiales bacterium]|nr:glycosyltransferase [Burkholderiales bacterium]
MKIVILTAASLAWNPRALKEAAALARAGHDVVVIGSHAGEGRLEGDMALARRHGFRFEPALSGPARELRWAWVRACGRVGRELFRLFGVENRWQLGLLAGALLRRAKAERADYYIAHNEPGLWAGARLLRAGRCVGVDLEDWHSEDLLPEARTQRPLGLLRALEVDLLCNGAHATCPSAAMSTALAAAYGCRPPTPVYNAFAWSDRAVIDDALKDRSDRGVPSIHWYSQAIGPGRGLEELFAALPYLHSNAQFHLRGQPVAGVDDWLRTHIPPDWRHRVHVHGIVPVDELLSRIAEHDIGFAGEMKYCRSRDLTVTNKMLHYLLAGLAVIASDTAGQKEIAAEAGDAVWLYPAGDARALAERLDGLLRWPDALRRAKAAALAAAESTFCWERQEGILMDVVSRALRALEERGSAR